MHACEMEAALLNLIAEAEQAADALETEGNDGDAGILRVQIESARQTVGKWKYSQESFEDDLDEGEACPTDLERAVLAWWRGHRPLRWTGKQHCESPCVNVSTFSGKWLAEEAAQLSARYEKEVNQ